jgi:hypothetical protein
VGLIGYARELEAQQRMERSRTAGADRADRPLDPAHAGYPGAWDDDEAPRVAAR